MPVGTLELFEKEVLCPAQTVSDTKATTGKGNTGIVISELFVQPDAFVMVTVYVVPAVGLTVSWLVLAPFDH